MIVQTICQELMTVLMLWRDVVEICSAEITSLTTLINVPEHSQEKGWTLVNTTCVRKLQNNYSATEALEKLSQDVNAILTRSYAKICSRIVFYLIGYPVKLIIPLFIVLSHSRVWELRRDAGMTLHVMHYWGAIIVVKWQRVHAPCPVGWVQPLII